jgi:hypothetical protein
MNPPPPPPHGEGVPKQSGLPPGNYDIFIIPPHSSGSGFLYLPSLKPNVNSFAAGFASALILVVVGSALAPVVQAWWAGVKGSGGTGMIMIMLAIGVGAWALGRAQNDGGTVPGGSGGGPSPGGSPHGASEGATHGASHGAPPPNSHASGSGPGPGPGTGTGSRMPGGGGEKPKPTWGRTNASPDAGYGASSGAGAGAGTGTSNPNGARSGWEKAREEMKKKEEERKAREAEKKAKEEAERKLKEAREKEMREREARERKEREREREKDKEREREREKEREREMEREREREREREKERERERERDRERERERELERELEKQREREALRKQLEKEALEKLREKEALKKEIEKELLERQQKEEALKKQQEKEPQEKAQKEAQKEAPKEEPKVKSTYAFSSVGEKTNPWPKGHPAVSPIRPPPSPTKKPPAPTVKTYLGTEEDRRSFRPYDKLKKPVRKKSLSSIYSESSYAASYTTGATTPPPSHRSPYSTKDPDKIVIKAVYAFTNAFLRTPTSQLVSGVGSVTDGLILRITTEGLFIDDDVRGVPQREWDVKAWTMKLVEVWCPKFRNGASASTSATQSASASRSTAHPNPVRRLWNHEKDKAAMNEEADALLIDMLQTCKDSCRFASLASNPSSPASASGSTTKSSNRSRNQTGELKSARLHVLRASIRDQEGKRYVFVLTEEESWKVAIGLQRLRRGTQVRALGVSTMSATDVKSTLENLGWG